MAAAAAASERILLPSHFVPLRYDLSLVPDLKAHTFAGTVSIDFRVDAAKLNDDNANVVTLHAKELCFESAEYCVVAEHGEDGAAAAAAGTAAATTPIKADEIRVKFRDHTVQFVFGRAVPATADRIRVTVRYAGCLNNQMAGFYRSSYTDITGRQKTMASTQFESIDARRAFPCVDEPAAKAVFGLAVTVPAGMQCVSNMPAASADSLTDGRKRIRYLDSPSMSTYLLAFCVGEFDYVQSKTRSGVMVTVYTPPGKSASGQFALDTAVQCLDAYDEFFQVRYPLPKLDMIAIPEFAMGAMENWGCVTYREVDLLIDPVTAAANQRQRVAVVVAHELSHQWFGNLVTMAWWSGLWLNEAFASWCENWAVDRLFPSYHMWDQFTTDHLSAALRMDSLVSSHPIEVPIAAAEEVEQVFDAISYCKGACVVRMIQSVLGMEHFQTGLAAYMKKHAYGNTETADLWNAWETASGMPVGDLMKTWTEQKGFPLLTVVKEDWKADSVTLELEQSWFLSDGSDPADVEDGVGADKKWTIPVMTCTAAGTQDDMTLMRDRTCTVTVPVTAAGGWLKLNAGQEVPMRVLPGQEMLRRLEAGIRAKEVPHIDRAGLVTDAYALVKAGKMEPEQLLRLLNSYTDEHEHVVWEGMSEAVLGLDAVMSDDEEMSARFASFAKKFALKLQGLTGWDSRESDDHVTTLLRGIMVSLVSKFAHDDDAVKKEAASRFEAFLKDCNDVKSLPSDMRTAVFKIVLKNGGKQEYESVKQYFYQAADDAERKHVLHSLGHTPDKGLKLATMDWSVSGDIKLQDLFYAMGSVGRSGKAGREISWKYFQDNFTKIETMFATANPSLMDANIVLCAGGFCTREKAAEIQHFFEEHPLPRNTRKIAQMTENMLANAKFYDALKDSDLSKGEFWNSLS